MERSYDIFEVMPDGTLVWRTTVVGHEQAIIALKNLAAQTKNEVLLMHLETRTTIAVMNAPAR